MRQMIHHEIEPVFDENSRVLVLGTIPSPKSRETGFFYGNPQNRFWRVLAKLFDEPLPQTIAEKRDFLLRHHIALWDVLASCDIEGASDASIANAQPNDLKRVLETADIRVVFATGAKAGQLYRKLCESDLGIPCHVLPSPSPANAKFGIEALTREYQAMLPYLNEFEPPALEVAKVVELEQAIARSGTSLAELMERAGRALAWRVAHAARKICTEESPRVCILCGTGNNGGDGWVAARHLIGEGFQVDLVTSRLPEEITAQPALDAARKTVRELSSNPNFHTIINPNGQSLSEATQGASVIVDAILGTGFTHAAVRAPYDTWIEAMNAAHAQGAYVIAADTPSGLSADTGNAATPCVIANETVTMITMKKGLAAPNAQRFCGTITRADLAYIEPFFTS